MIFVLTLGSKERFGRSGDVGCYLGLRPPRSESKTTNLAWLIEWSNHILRPHGDEQMILNFNPRKLTTRGRPNIAVAAQALLVVPGGGHGRRGAPALHRHDRRAAVHQQPRAKRSGLCLLQAARFELLPRLKTIHSQRLYRPDTTVAYSKLGPVLSRTIDWELIAQQYDQMVKYATALRLGTADTEDILRRFNRTNVQHPVYRALGEFGKAIKTIFLCRYLHSIELRREIHEGLNVIGNWNGANDFIFFGKGGEMASNRADDQEISMLSLHLVQLSLVYINTLMIQQVLAEPAWSDRLNTDDRRGITPMIHSHINPYGSFRLDLSSRLPIDPPRFGPKSVQTQMFFNYGQQTG